MNIALKEQAISSCLHLLGEINRDPTSSSYGCFDRRYWAWKLTDFPEATFQRNLSGLSWYLHQLRDENQGQFLVEVIKSGLKFTLKVQHPDGSFDQAYPHEHSFGATGFLLPDLINAFLEIRSECGELEIESIAGGLRDAADFLVRSSEQHSLISNHLAGAALGLFKAGELFQENRYFEKARSTLSRILKSQSHEGWFPEYGGADPGYQTLCMHYLAQIYKLEPSAELKLALERSLDFLKYFAHPDGTFGGEYGSRRTEIYYPGGIALMADEFSDAAGLHDFMRTSIEAGNTVALADIDMGNTAPLLNSYILAADQKILKRKISALPFQVNSQNKDFPKAGIAIRSRQNYFLLLGASNGGVLKIFDKQSGRLLLDDCGVFGVTKGGKKITTQSTQIKNLLQTSDDKLECNSSFYPIKDSLPNPLNYLALRLLNLTLMRIGFLNELMKKLMVRLLVKNESNLNLSRTRKIALSRQAVDVTDTFTNPGQVQLQKLSQGFKFTSIHMASARYFTSSQATPSAAQILDHGGLNLKGLLKVSHHISFTKDLSGTSK